MPITEKKHYYEWMLAFSNRIVWLMNLNLDGFTHNLAELIHLKNLGCDISLVFNNSCKIQDQDLMFYLWEKMESSLEIQAAGMIPYISDVKENLDTLASKMDENIGPLVTSIVSG